ncbi:hypothetical protein CLAFUW4_01217 [Fulvia fulva]|uniref:Uncharacterized protein n=1 Tax=Passalora fulva TaxID=5499 RepID=A0A9Q8P364_PASFU|nr:uncharacterized protein CLAFUR5_01222 [Fulvia fulva]KAK4635341.1 hypothetical protein CLAFUR4_01218 [Fulvia fulva]KAK4637435.1 hypothetical protein CLAFUR0_01219 [Fulvia fulva]UJO11431.1 hypothetical protein CLAFUR5_01222 [Fulvia fulva]WPV08095.1 hypothetical protein CLAFUW4_01217 [Fulvia fulva]WPV23628.1 hypothetical protein CLAFUW7_01222 [Fulvia fulva]
MTEDFILLDDSEAMSARIEEFIRQATSDLISQESTAFVQNTLKRAQVLVELEDSNAAPPRTGQTSRSSYSLQDQLLKNVIELWSGIMLLASHKDIDVSTQHHPLETHENVVNGIGTAAKCGVRSDGMQNITSQSRVLIIAQLLAMTESRCTVLAKIVTNEIERRLLQRQQVSRVSTFMSAVILLNCVERITGLYWSLDPEPSWTTQEGIMPPAWPLDTSPHKFWLQGEPFADLLIMLLRMRGLPPKTTTSQDGSLVMVPDPPSRITSDHGRNTVLSGNQACISVEWLDSAQLKVVDLLRTRDDGARDEEAGIRAFDLAFNSKVLLPASR